MGLFLCQKGGQNMQLQEIIKRMDSDEQVTIKGNKSNKGIEISAYHLRKYLYEVKKIAGNKRGGISITIDELEFEHIARSFGYNV